MAKRSLPPSPRVKKRKHSRQNSASAPAHYATAAAETWTAIGSCAAAMGVHHVALQAFEAALVHSPGSLRTLLGWSHALRMNDVASNETVGCQAALQRLTAAAEQYPALASSADFFRELTECYLLVNLNEPAQQAVQQAIRLQPHDAALFLLSAQASIRTGSRAAAAAALAHCLALLPGQQGPPGQPGTLSPGEVETARTAHAELAAIAAAEGNIEQSIRELAATLALPPPPHARVNEHIALWCALATAFERANQIPEALDACERAERAVGSSPRILLTHAYLLLLDESKARAETAVALLTRVVEQEPRGGPKGKDDAAEPAAEDAAGDFLPWCLLGKAYTLLDSPRAAYDAYQIALRRADGSPITWLAVGKLYLELKQLPDALAAYSQALRLQLNENSPGTAAAWDGLSCVYERCDDQLGDAADACSRAALCFQAYGDGKSAELYETRAKNLRLAAQGKAPVPEWSEPVGVPNYFLRDLVNLLPNERIAFVKSAHKPDMEVVPKGHSGSPNTRKTETKRFDAPFDAAYPGRGPYKPAHPYDALPRGTPVVSTPPPQQQYVHGTSLVQVGPERAQPAYLAPPYKSDAKSPGPVPQQMHPRQYWQAHDQASQHPMMRPPPPLSAQYGPPPAAMMSPPSVHGPAGPHRSPAVHPQVTAEGYAVAVPPGYAYGQYMPIHGGMVAQAQPYAGAHWRR